MFNIIKKWSVFFIGLAGISILLAYVYFIYPSNNIDSSFGFNVKINYQHTSNVISCQHCHLNSDSTSSFFSDLITQLNPENVDNFEYKCIQCHGHLKHNPLNPHTLELDGDISQCKSCHFEHKGKQSKPLLNESSDWTNCHKNQTTDLNKIHKQILLRGNDVKSWNFNHTNHQVLHFQKTNHSFDCFSCHQPEENGKMLNVQFDPSCSSCHQHTNQIKQNPLTLIQIPGLDYDVLIDEEINIGEWPLDAGIDLEESINPYLIQLLSLDGKSAYDVLIDEEVEFIDLIDGADYAHELETLFWDFKLVLFSLSKPHIIQEQFGLTSPLEIQFIIETIHDWFPNLSEEIINYKNGIIAETFVYEDYLTDDASINKLHKSAFDFNITYQSIQHTDPVLTNIYSTNYKKMESTLLIEKPGNCLKCHSIKKGYVDWKKHEKDELFHPLGKSFSHITHLKESKCIDCHIESDQGYEAITTESCMSCHELNNNENNCIVCHSYHPQNKGKIK